MRGRTQSHAHPADPVLGGREVPKRQLDERRPRPRGEGQLQGDGEQEQSGIEGLRASGFYQANIGSDLREP